MALETSLPIGFQEPVEATVGTGTVTSEEQVPTVETEMIDVPAAAAQDIAAQRGKGQSQEDLSNEFRSIMNSKTFDDIAASGVESIGNELLTPRRIEEIKADPGLYAALEFEYISQKRVPQQDEFKAALPYSSADYTEVRLPSWMDDYDPDFKAMMTDAVKNRQNVARLLNETNPNLSRQGQELILEQFKTGDSLTEFLRTTEHLVGDFPRMTYLGPMILNAGIAFTAAANASLTDSQSFDDVFGTEFGSRMASSGFINGFERILNNSVVLESRQNDLQREYKKLWIEKFGETERKVEGKMTWREAHQVPMIEMVDGNPQYARDENGEIIYRDRGLDAASANGILELAYDELPASSKAALFFWEQAPFTLGGTVIATTRSAGALSKVKNERFMDDGSGGKVLNPAFADKTDFELYQEIRKRDRWAITAPLSAAFNKLTFGNKRAEGRINRGHQLTDHQAVIARYDEDIAEINELLNNGVDIEGNPLDDAGRTALLNQKNVLTDSVRSYKLRKGTGSVNSPYLRTVAADDVLISTAIGIGAASMPTDLSVYGVDGDILVGITAPLIAPSVSRIAVWGGTKAINSFTENTLQDVGMMLENSGFLPFVTPGTIVGGDEAKMRQVMREMGRPVTDKDVKAFSQLNKLFNQMTPEYREKAYQALLDYNKMIVGFRNDMVGVGMTTEEIAEALPALHLTVAEATGIAPLIAFQRQNAEDINASNLQKKMPEILETLGAEEAALDGMSTNLDLLKRLIAKGSKIDMDSNVPLQQLMNDTAESITLQRGNLNQRKQELYLALNRYVDNIGSNESIDSNTIDMLVSLEEELVEALPAGTVSKTMSRGEKIASVHNRILLSAQNELESLSQLSADLSDAQFTREVRRIADIMFDAEHGRRKALVSAEYRKVDELVPEGQTLDMTSVMRKLVDLTEGMEGMPLSEVFSGKKGFMNRRGGQALYNAMSKMARRGIQGKISDEAATLLIEQRRNECNGNYSYVDLALEMAENANQPLEFFAALPSEVEDVYRFFNDRAVNINRNAKAPTRTEAEITAQFRDAVDEVYAEFSPELLAQINKARDTHRIEIGNRTDKGRYAQQVIDGRERKEPADIAKAEGKRHYYPNLDDAPEAPFRKIAELSSKLVSGAGDQEEIVSAIQAERKRIMYFLGARMEGEQMVFDFNDKTQRRSAYLAHQLLETMISKKLTDDIARDTDVAITSLQEGMDMISQKGYDFQRAMRVIDVENALRVSYIPEGGTAADLISDVAMDLSAVKNHANTYDKMLRRNKTVQEAYQKLRKDVDLTAGVLGIAQKAELDEINNTIGVLQQRRGLINNPQSFYAEFFENATAKSFNDTVQQFIDESGGKLTEKQVRTAMKYMYLRGTFSRAGVRTGIDAPSGKVKADVTKVNQFIDDVYDPRKAEVMEAVLGKDHMKHLRRIARWSSYKMGDALDFRAGRATKGLSIDSVFSRVFNIARGMVSPLYVGTETATRMMLENKQNLINLALSDRQAAEFMAKVLTQPERLTDLDIETFGIRVGNYLARAAAEQGQNIVPTIEQRLQVEQQEQEQTDENVQ